MLGAENNLIFRKYPHRGHHGVPKHPREDWPKELGALKIWGVGFSEAQGLLSEAGNPSQTLALCLRSSSSEIFQGQPCLILPTAASSLKPSFSLKGATRSSNLLMLRDEEGK